MAYPAELLGDYAKELWALSNTIAAFSILQSLTFAYGLQNEQFRLGVLNSLFAVKRASAGCTFLYVIAIAVIDCLQANILLPFSTELAVVVISISALKLAAVIVSGAGSIFLADSVDDQGAAHRWLTKKEHSSRR